MKFIFCLQFYQRCASLQVLFKIFARICSGEREGGRERERERKRERERNRQTDRQTDRAKPGQVVYKVYYRNHKVYNFGMLDE